MMVSENATDYELNGFSDGQLRENFAKWRRLASSGTMDSLSPHHHFLTEWIDRSFVGDFDNVEVMRKISVPKSWKNSSLFLRCKEQFVR